MKVLLLGYFGYGNYGDEWSLQAVSSAVSRCLPNGEVTVVSADPEYTRRLHGLPAVGRGFSSLRNAVSGCDLLVAGGGSLLQDATSLHSLLFYLAIIGYAQRKGKKVVLWGQGLGPLKRRVSRQLTVKILNGVDLITLRDSASWRLLTEIGVTRPEIHLAADPVFGADLPEISAKREPVITVVLRDWPSLAPSRWLPPLAQAVSTLAMEKGLKVQVYSFQAERDRPIACSFQELLAYAGLECVVHYGWQSLEAPFYTFAKSRLVVAQRYHALALAALAGTPSLALAYDPKVVALAGELGISSLNLKNNSNPDRIQQVIREALTKDQSGVQDAVGKLQKRAAVSGIAFKRLAAKM
ncbi:MAG: polysaccharide pyruvyl transferase CsaB [Firmicutes bacterium]|nr:polysaccharide pyruvyl transferase CsaB [Bacillota bacterium]